MPWSRDVRTQKPSACIMFSPGKKHKTRQKSQQVQIPTWCQQCPDVSWGLVLCHACPCRLCLCGRKASGCGGGAALVGRATQLSPSSPSFPAPFFTGLILFFPPGVDEQLTERRGPAACRWQQENRQTKQMDPAGVKEHCLQPARGTTKE